MSAIGRYRPFQPHKYPKTVRFNAYSVHISASTVAGGCDGSCNRFFCVVLISSDAETTVPAHSSGNEATFSLEFCGQRQFMCLWYISVCCVVGQFCLYWLYNCPNVRRKYACNLANGQFDFRNGSNYPNLRQMKWFHGNFGELPFARYVNYPMHFEKLKSSLKSGEFLLVRNMNCSTPQKNASREGGIG